MKKLYALAILTTLALGTVALAEPGKHGPGKKLERLDANKDGKVTLQEMKSEANARFAELDVDKNGRVSTEELAAHHEKKRAEHEQKRAARGEGDGPRGSKDGHCGKMKGGHFFARMDENGDGAVDKKELESKLEERFARMDENGDRVLEASELRHGRGLHGKRHGRGHDHDREHGKGAAGSGAKR